MEVIDFLIFTGIGVGTGFFSGLFGIGGGSIRIPLLALTGMPLIDAFGTNMFAIPFSSAVGAYEQRMNIRWDIVRIFAAGGVVGIVLSTYLAGVLSSRFLAVVFFLAAVLTVLGLYLHRINHRVYESIRPTPRSIFSSAFIANLVIGLRGGSGGTLFPPLLRSMHIEMHHAIATSLFTGMFSSLIALGIYILRGDIVLVPASIVAVTGILGSYAGSKLSIHTDSRWLKLGMAVMVLALAFSVLYREI